MFSSSSLPTNLWSCNTTLIVFFLCIHTYFSLPFLCLFLLDYMTSIYSFLKSQSSLHSLWKPLLSLSQEDLDVLAQALLYATVKQPYDAHQACLHWRACVPVESTGSSSFWTPLKDDNNVWYKERFNERKETGRQEWNEIEAGRASVEVRKSQR